MTPTQVIDDVYAANTQYHLEDAAGAADCVFGPSPYQPFRNATRWAWKTALAACTLSRTTLVEFCSQIHRLNLKRVLFVGDSLTFMQFQSLWKLLGLAGEPKHPWGRALKHWAEFIAHSGDSNKIY